MKLSTQNSRLLNYFFFFLALTLACLIFCLFMLKNIAIDQFNSDNERYQSYVVADRLRQSSDDLTRMARLYVSTGKQKYRDFYHEILSIRKGMAPRPIRYDELYWDLITNDARPRPYGPAKSLSDMLLEQHLTLREFALLNDAENSSDQLSQTEIKAMELMEGNYEDNNGQFTIKGKPDPQLAKQLLFGDEYMKEKAKVMAPIQTFFAQVNLRTHNTNNALNTKMSKIILVAIILAILSTLLTLSFILQALKSLSKANEEKELLLLNILPETIASRLKLGEEDIADEYPQASVMFADIINFTALTEHLGAKKTVHILNQLFAELDCLSEKYHVEKVKTIGDNYMAVSGVPIQTTKHAENIANYALEILKIMEVFNASMHLKLQLRIGITYGTVIAGIIGHKKFAYDIWGNVVNLASRLEESSLPNKIHISEKMAFMLKDEYILELRGAMTIKGVGEMNTYFLVGKKELPTNDRPTKS